MVSSIIILSLITLFGATVSVYQEHSRQFLLRSLLISCVLLTALWDVASWLQILRIYPSVLFSIIIVSCVALLYKFFTEYRIVARYALRYFKSPSFLVDLLIIVATGVYVAIVGVYLEIPADVFAHLEGVQIALNNLRIGLLGSDPIWYSLIALVLNFSGEDIREILQSFTYLTMTIFLLGVRCFTSEVGRRLLFNNGKNAIFSLLGVFLTAILFGTSVFSYLRYYTFAPGYIAYLMFLLGALVATDLQFNRNRLKASGSSLLILLSCFFVTVHFHKQEALFLLLFIVYSFTWECASYWRFKNNWNRLGVSFIPITVLGVIVLASVVSYIYLMFSGSFAEVRPPLFNNTITLSWLPGNASSLQIADPLGRAYETLGLLGLTVITLYFIPTSRSYRTKIITVLIFVPLLAIFNPIFTEIFLQWTMPSVLWRLTYMVPIGVVAALCILSMIEQLKVKLVLALISLAIIFLQLVPFPGLEQLQHTRYTSLSIIDKRNTPRHWADLIEFMSERQGINILTDPVTGYMLGALTGVSHSHSKFHATKIGDINKSQYGPNSFVDHAKEGDWMFVVNLRDGIDSINGKRSGHWSRDISLVSNYYSDQLLNWLSIDRLYRTHLLSELPPHFELVWYQDSIWVFLLKQVDT
ncbi:MAG: hypothetical protein CL398_01890 [Acidiferrobacteraceae bacterium]|nr:hypothetical protein [Acidiferrobacteraceae bacterium]